MRIEQEIMKPTQKWSHESKYQNMRQIDRQKEVAIQLAKPAAFAPIIIKQNI